MIEQRDFNSGWIASDDAYSGRKNGLLRMDNLCLDENGAVTLVRGTQKISGSALASIPHTLYGRYIGVDYYRYAACIDGNTYRDKNRLGAWDILALTGGSTKRSSFRAALNQVYTVSGQKAVKDNGTTQTNIGLVKASTPTTVAEIISSPLDLQNLDAGGNFTNWRIDTGTLLNNASTYVQATADTSLFQTVYRTVFGSVKDCNTFPNGGYGLPSDNIQFYLRVFDSSQLTKVRVELLTYDPGAAPTTTAPINNSYYYYEWNSFDVPEPWTSNQWNQLIARRDKFIQSGDTNQNAWSKILSIRVICFHTTGSVETTLDEIEISGGSNAALRGTYAYYQQNVNNTGTYLAVSPMSDKSKPIDVTNSRAFVTPNLTGLESQVNQIRIYRIEINTQSVPTLLKVLTTPYAPFYDGVNDADLLSASAITGNFFLQAVKDIPDPILGMEGLFFGRMLYFTASKVYISEFLDPDAYDSRLVLGYSGNAAETFLWGNKVSNSVIYVGTDLDVYEFTGTLSINPDGTIDANIRPLGIQYPPVSEAMAIESGSVIYMANDGWRALGVYGNNSLNLSINLSLLFRGYDRYGFLHISPGYDDVILSRACINKDKFYSIVTSSDGSQKLFVFDMSKKYWYPTTVSAVCIFSEEDGTLIGGFSDKFVRTLDTPGIYTQDGVTQPINLLTPIFDDGAPNQRKDCYTFKFVIDTGGSILALNAFVNQSSVGISLANLQTTGLTEFTIDVNNAVGINLCKSIQFQITGNPAFFKLADWNLQHELRPIQLTRKRIAPENFGSFARKRTTVFPPIVIDTLGNNVTFTPIIDGVTFPSTTFNTVEKTTQIYYFSSEVDGIDFGGYLSGSNFEYYGMAASDFITEKLPPKVKFQIVSESNDGTYSKKRRRAIAFVINTFKLPVPISAFVDGTLYNTQNYTTNYKATQVYYFTSDVIGTDFKLQIGNGVNPFEFYGLLQNTDVEILPPGKIWDQIGPLDLGRQGYLERMQVRLISEASLINYNLFADDTLVGFGSFNSLVGKDDSYEIVFPRNYNGQTARIELTSSLPFYRFSAKVKLRGTGTQTEGKWVSL